MTIENRASSCLENQLSITHTYGIYLFFLQHTRAGTLDSVMKWQEKQINGILHAYIHAFHVHFFPLSVNIVMENSLEFLREKKSNTHNRTLQSDMTSKKCSICLLGCDHMFHTEIVFVLSSASASLLMKYIRAAHKLTFCLWYFPVMSSGDHVNDR